MSCSLILKLTVKLRTQSPQEDLMAITIHHEAMTTVSRPSVRLNVNSILRSVREG